jgi:UDP-N-acetylmuramyl pentapeptide phosphotransferase/UDP-N-acetylglucosamine-1-phosphate transferase
MIEILILAFSAFFISLIGTKWVIFTIRSRAASPDIKLLMGKKKAPPLADAGIALTFAMIIGMLGAENSLAVVLPMFFLAGIALLEKTIRVLKSAKITVYIVSITIGLSVFPIPILGKFLAGIFWLLIIRGFSKLKNTESLLPACIISIGFGLATIAILAGNFPSPLATNSLIFAGAGLGFLWWNHKPAKVFAGAIGAMPAGFVAGYLLLLMIVGLL